MRTTRRLPLTILAASVLTAMEALALLVVAVLEVVSGDGTTGVGLAIFFLLCAVGVGWCAWTLSRLTSWARAPIVFLQLVMLGLAWDGRHNAAVAVILLVVAVATLVALFHPASLAALEPRDD